MTIHLPEDVENSIKEQVSIGNFANVGEALAIAWRAFVSGQDQKASFLTEKTNGKEQPTPSKPIWEVFQDLSATVPDEVWDRLPTDLSDHHDHYIYGTPK
jgi:Arc/MetJ-type ribon-helix-helix transcriptional regulator